MMTIEPVTSSNWELLVRLFEQSPECSDCWCMNHRSDPNACPTGENAKISLRKAIETNAAHGLIALIDEHPVGWCAVDSVQSQIGHDYCLQTEATGASSAWMIHCLYVDPKFRGAGVSKELIKEAIEFARKSGASELLAFPIPEESGGKFPKDIAEFSGRLSTFQKLEFQKREQLNNFYQVVSKRL